MMSYMKSFLFFEIKAINILWVMLTGIAKCPSTTFLKFFRQLFLSFLQFYLIFSAL